MSDKKLKIRLSPKAIEALKLIYENPYKSRVSELEKISEYGFSILLYWNILESLLKILKYYDKIDQPYPDKLNFINRNWRILKVAHHNDAEKYELVLGAGSKKSGTLWKERDKITHVNHMIEKGEYNKFKSAITSLIKTLKTNLPESFDIAHQNFLQHRKSKFA